jgi:hypothetical protein
MRVVKLSLVCCFHCERYLSVRPASPGPARAPRTMGPKSVSVVSTESAARRCTNAGERNWSRVAKRRRRGWGRRRLGPQHEGQPELQACQRDEHTRSPVKVDAVGPSPSAKPQRDSGSVGLRAPGRCVTPKLKSSISSSLRTYILFSVQVPVRLEPRDRLVTVV